MKVQSLRPVFLAFALLLLGSGGVLLGMGRSVAVAIPLMVAALGLLTVALAIGAAGKDKTNG